MRKTCLCMATALALMSASPSDAADARAQKAAARYIAITAFVQNRCETMRVNLAAVRMAITILGVDPDSLENSEDSQDDAKVYFLALESNRDQACSLIWDKFGETGTVLRGLVAKR